MNKALTKSRLLPEVERRLHKLSVERLRVANDFLAYLEDRESSDATQELLKIIGFQEAFQTASQQVDSGEIINFEDIRRDV